MRRPNVKIQDKNGYSVFYDPERKLFYLEDAEGNEVGSASTQDKVEALIPEITKLAFKLPIPAILSLHSSVEKGRITSLNLHQGTAYFSYDDKGHGTTEKIALQYDKAVYELTEGNERIVSQIEKNLAQKKRLTDQIEALKEQFERPINLEYFGM
jgi:hypothetical protein